MITEKKLLRRISVLRPWQLSAVAIVLSEFVTAGMSLLLRGFIAADYLITGLVASLLVSYSILKLLSFHQTELVERVAERGAELGRANTLLENEIESSPDAILVVDAKGRMASFNQRFLNLWSIPPEIAQSRDDAAALASVRDKLKDPEKFFAGVRRLYEHPEEHVRDEIELKDGRILDRYSAGMHDAANEYLGRIWFFRDITERKRAEEQLRKLSQAVEQSSNIILITDTNGIIEYVNPKFTEVTGYTAEEAFGRTPALFGSRLTSGQRYEEFWKSLATNQGWHGEFLNRKKNGDLFWCEEYVAPIRDSGGKVTHFVAVETDITERRKTAEQLQQAQKMETVGRLAGGIAHDFNNQLMVIQGNLELLLEKLHLQTEVGGLADRALHAAGRSADLVSQLLLFSRKQFLQPQAVDVGALIARMKDLLSSTVMETVSVQISVPDDLWHAYIDPAQLENALLNLAFNARDAMPKGGTMSIEAANVEMARGQMPADSDVTPGSFVRITVADIGMGMTPEVLARAFEPFFTTKEVGKGSWLGLSMVYGFVKQSGGYIEIDSAPGSGTRVDLYLRKTEPERVAWTPRPEAAGPVGGETILVVEDNPEVRKIAVSFLGQLGYRLIEAADGPAALAVLESKQVVDLLFTDIVMPGGISGVELARKALDLRPGIKLLFATGYAEEAAPGGSALAAGGHMLSKPYRKDDLAQAVWDALKTPTSR